MAKISSIANIVEEFGGDMGSVAKQIDIYIYDEIIELLEDIAQIHQVHEYNDYPCLKDCQACKAEKILEKLYNAKPD